MLFDTHKQSIVTDYVLLEIERINGANSHNVNKKLLKQQPLDTVKIES